MLRRTVSVWAESKKNRNARYAAVERFDLEIMNRLRGWHKTAGLPAIVLEHPFLPFI